VIRERLNSADRATPGSNPGVVSPYNLFLDGCQPPVWHPSRRFHGRTTGLADRRSPTWKCGQLAAALVSAPWSHPGFPSRRWPSGSVPSKAARLHGTPCPDKAGSRFFVERLFGNLRNEGLTFRLDMIIVFGDTASGGSGSRGDRRVIAVP
jgi:hypothetical protein